MTLPRISVVTCSWNQGRYIGRNIESVLAQDYPNLEHIIVDNVSTDETPEVLARYPHLKVIREPDGGQAEAINKGFRAATGDIYCFLNSDDTFLPDALHRVAEEIDPARGRHIVLGRCLFTDEDGQPTGLEQPSAFVSHERILEVWKGHHIPQPATFWTREVWERCGPLDETEQLVLDYDLMCRFSKHYKFHTVDQVLATWRLHDSSKSCSNDSSKIYAEAIRVSRRYWGSPLSFRYWRLWSSLAEYRLEQRTARRKHAAALAVKGFRARNAGQLLKSVAFFTQSALLAPAVAVRRLALQIEAISPRRAEGSPVDLWMGRSPITRAWRSFFGVHKDGCIGPVHVRPIRIVPGQENLSLELLPLIPGLGGMVNLEVAIDGRLIQQYQVRRGQRFSLNVPLTGFGWGNHELTLTVSPFLVVNDLLGNGDRRPLAFRLGAVEIQSLKQARVA